MKKRVTTILLFALVFAFGAFTGEAKAQTSAVALSSFQELASSLPTPEKIAGYIFRHFSYESDRAQFGSDEVWQSTDELMNTKKGDCEDFALFASEVLKANGISSFLVNVYGNNFAHTVTVFREDGKFHVIDGDQVKRFSAGTLQELFTKIYPHWNEAQLVGFDANKRCGRVLKTFKA